MKDSNSKNNNKKEVEPQRYKEFFNSFNEVSETDEVLQQLASLNFNEDKSINMQNSNINMSILDSKLGLNEEDKNIQNIQEQKQQQNINNSVINSNNNNYDEKPLSIILLKEKINRIIITMQGLNFNDKNLNNLNEFIPHLNNIEQKNYKYIDKLLDVYVELLLRIKNEIRVQENFIQKLNEVSLSVENYEKKNLLNQKIIKDKENEVSFLMNQLNLEKYKNRDNSKSMILEISSLKKENEELTNTILLYKNKLRKTEADYIVTQEKFNNLLEKEKKNKISSFISNLDEKNENGLNSSKMNDKYFSIKKLNMSLTFLIKEINRMLIKYDSILNQLKNNNNSEQDKVIDLNCHIETNLLLDEANMKIFRKNFLYNMERIFKKIENIDNKYIKEVNINNNNEAKGAWKKNIINKKTNEEINSIFKNNKNNNNENNGINDINDEKHFKNNISQKWYDKYNYKKIGYVFDKEKVITCEDDDNGGK